jgi:hypothetical protein
LCERIGVRPTYFTDYAVVNDTEAAGILKAMVNRDTCEIGAHLHPWCNPPFYGKTTEKESHIVNLPISQVEEKLDILLELLTKTFGTAPNAFRSGRWGVNSDVLGLLEKKGFQVDSSMYPFFKNEYFDCEHTPLTPYWPDYRDPMTKGSQRNIREIPVTAGFNHKHFSLMQRISKAISHPIIRPLRLTGIFWHSHLLRKLYLSPEVTSAQDMQVLIDSALDNEAPVIHMYLHSSSLISGATGYMKQKYSLNVICKSIEQVVEHIRFRSNIQFCTISEAATLLRNRLN